MSPGVSLPELLAGVALSRGRGERPDATRWSAVEWSRVWAFLTPAQQRVVYLYAVVGLQQDQIAAELGCAPGNVSGIWRRAMRALRGALPIESPQ